MAWALFADEQVLYQYVAHLGGLVCQRVVRQVERGCCKSAHLECPCHVSINYSDLAKADSTAIPIRNAVTDLFNENVVAEVHGARVSFARRDLSRQCKALPLVGR